MKQIYLFLMFVGLLHISGCATYPKDDIKVDVEANPKVNFKGYKTYAWLGTAEIVNDPEGRWEPLNFDADAEVTFLINRELRKRGMSENNTNPELIVGYALGVNMAAIETRIDPKTNIKLLEDVPKSALLLIFIDGETGSVVWAGGAMGKVKNLGPEVAKKRINYAVTQMFEKLPK